VIFRKLIGQGRHSISSLPVVYVCQNRHCDTLMTSPQVLVKCSIAWRKLL